MNFELELAALETSLIEEPLNAWKKIENVIAEIQTIDEFKSFFLVLERHLDTLVPQRESYLADDYLGAINTVMSSGFEQNPIFSRMKSDLGRVAWFLVLALETE